MLDGPSAMMSGHPRQKEGTMRAFVPAAVALAVLLAGCGGSPHATPAHGARSKAPHTSAKTRKAPARTTAAVAAPVHYSRQVIILMYHGIAPVAHGDFITPKAFAGEIQALEAQGFHFVSLGQVASFLAGGSLPTNAVAITFDDGLESVYTYAYPVLSANKVPFATFLIVNRIGRFPGDLSWAQVKAMEQSGLITVGSHTLASHGTVPTGNGKTGPALTSLIDNPATGEKETQTQYTARVTADLLHARQILRAETGQPVVWFAYPFGSYDQQVEHILSQEGYRYAVLAEWGWGVTRSALPLEIPRINTGTPKTTPGNIPSTLEYVASLTARDPTAVPPASYVPSW